MASVPPPIEPSTALAISIWPLAEPTMPLPVVPRIELSAPFWIVTFPTTGMGKPELVVPSLIPLTPPTILPVSGPAASFSTFRSPVRNAEMPFWPPLMMPPVLLTVALPTRGTGVVVPEIWTSLPIRIPSPAVPEMMPLVTTEAVFSTFRSPVTNAEIPFWPPLMMPFALVTVALPTEGSGVVVPEMTNSRPIWTPSPFVPSTRPPLLSIFSSPVAKTEMPF